MLKSKVLLLVLGILTFTLSLSGQAFASSSDEIMTDQPPEEAGLFSVFDPNFKYLDDGSANISNLGNNKVSIWGQTLGTRKVDAIGVQLTLQRWTGDEWIDVNTGAKSTFKDASYAYFSNDINASNGFYYRVKSTHWVIYNGLKEEGIRYSSTILVK